MKKSFKKLWIPFLLVLYFLPELSIIVYYIKYKSQLIIILFTLLKSIHVDIIYSVQMRFGEIMLEQYSFSSHATKFTCPGLLDQTQPNFT